MDSEDALDCNGWSRFVRIALLVSAGGLLLLLTGVLLAACCVKYRNKIMVIPYGSRKLSPNSGSVSNKQIGGSEWLPTSLNEKVSYVFSQTRLPSSEQHNNTTEHSGANGVYVCQLSSSHMHQAAAAAATAPTSRNLQSLQGPDLLELCRTPDPVRDDFTSASRQPARVILNSSGTTLREVKLANSRPTSRLSSSGQEDNNIQIPFCYYFE